LRHPAAKLSLGDVLWIRGLKGRVRQRTIAAIFGLSQSTVSEIQRGASWRWLAKECPDEQREGDHQAGDGKSNAGPEAVIRVWR
jgi:hypothetical protein